VTLLPLVWSWQIAEGPGSETLAEVLDHTLVLWGRLSSAGTHRPPSRKTLFLVLSARASWQYDADDPDVEETMRQLDEVAETEQERAVWLLLKLLCHHLAKGQYRLARDQLEDVAKVFQHGDAINLDIGGVQESFLAQCGPVPIDPVFDLSHERYSRKSDV